MAMGSRLGLPMASFHLISGDPEEADRPDPKTVIKPEAKKSTLSLYIHSEDHLPYFLFYNRSVFLCQLILYLEFPDSACRPEILG